jgi:hypothetical protein
MHTELWLQNVEKTDYLRCIDAVEDIIEMDPHNGGCDHEQDILFL